MTNQVLLCSCLGLAMCGAAFAQKSSSGPAPNAGAGRLPSLSTTQPNPNQQPNGNISDYQRPIYLSGKVTLEDGTPPPEPVLMQLVCGPTPRSVGYTDLKGRFDVNLNDRENNVLYADATESGGSPRGMTSSMNPTTRLSGANGGMTARSYAGCEFRAFMAGFRSDRVNLSNRRSLDDPNVGTIVLHRLGNVEGLTISATSALAPKDARKAYEKALNEEKKGKWPEAEKEYQKAVDAYPKYAAAWFHLGYAQQHENNVDAARQSYSKSLAADPKFVSPYLQLASLSAREQKWEETANYTDRLLSLNPVDFLDAWLYSAIANYELHRPEAAEKSAREGLKIDTAHRYPKFEQLLGVLLAQKHEYTEAAEHFRSFLKIAPDSPEADRVKMQLAEVEKVTAAQTEKKPE